MRTINLFIKHMPCTTNPSKYYMHTKTYDNNNPTDMFEKLFISGAFTRHRYNVYGFANYLLTV